MKTDFAIPNVCVVSVGAIFVLLSPVSPETNFDFDIFSFFWFVETQCATLDGTLNAASFLGLPL